MNWKQKQPRDMVNRIIACNIIREIGVEKIEKISDKKLKEVFLLPCTDEEGKDYNEIDWKAMIFTITDHEIRKLIDAFQPAPKDKPEEKNKEEPKTKMKLVDKHGKEI